MLRLPDSEIPKSPKDLPRALKRAISFEHATIPIYLYALYSLDLSRNAKIAGLLESIVREEMLHMLLACNLLNAIGGRPNLSARSFIPRFPCPVPGMIASGLEIGLERFSRDLVKRVFMEIEAPDDPIGVRAPAADNPSRLSVGEFYASIRLQLERAGERIFAHRRGTQIQQARMPGLIAITDLDSAAKALDVIVEQGEGTPQSPKSSESDYAHYYRFAEIYHGREISLNPRATRNSPPDDRYLYEGSPIPFDEAAVWRVPNNPRATDYAPGTRARRACDTFNYTYTMLLRALDDVVNGRKGDFDSTLGMMFSLRHQAIEMVSGVSTDGLHVGPSFEYQPLNPA